MLTRALLRSSLRRSPPSIISITRASLSNSIPQSNPYHIRSCIQSNVKKRRVTTVPHPRILSTQRPSRSQQRHSSISTNSRLLFRAHPIYMSLAVMLIIFGASSLVYTGYYYQQYIFSPSTKFPESVAKQLRKALYYTNTRPDAKQALGYYKKALEVADEEGMSPVSDEVLGIKIQIAQMFENQQLHENAIKVLETMMQDLRKWLELYGDSPDLVADRTRLLAKSVSISVTLGRLYAGEYVKQPAKAEEALVWAVETALKESKRRQDEGIKENEGPWLSDEEMGGSLESLATHFESRDLHYLAAPLYLQCLTLIPPRSCHRITLMANLSASLAQQIPPPLPNEPPASREALVGAAQQWAEKAIEMSKQIGPTDRDDECDVACAVALHHLAGFAERDGRIEDARASYQQSALLSRKIGFDEGWTQAAKGLQALGNGTGS